MNIECMIGIRTESIVFVRWNHILYAKWITDYMIILELGICWFLKYYRLLAYIVIEYLGLLQKSRDVLNGTKKSKMQDGGIELFNQ